MFDAFLLILLIFFFNIDEVMRTGCLYDIKDYIEFAIKLLFLLALSLLNFITMS